MRRGECSRALATAAGSARRLQAACQVERRCTRLLELTWQEPFVRRVWMRTSQSPPSRRFVPVRELGSIAVGKTANFTILGRNPFKVAPEAIREIPAEGVVSWGCTNGR